MYEKLKNGNSMSITQSYRNYKTPSKILLDKMYYPYFARFVLHGSAIKYASVEKTVKKKPLPSVPGKYQPIVRLEGNISYDTLFEYPNIIGGSEKELLDELSHSLHGELKKDVKSILSTLTLKDGQHISIYIFKY
jgi:hypothetical protein